MELVSFLCFGSGIIIVGSQANQDKSPEANQKPVLSFNEAVALARNGWSDHSVVDAIQYEFKNIENSASQAAVLNLKIDLAVAMLDCANNSPGGYDRLYEEYDRMYDEGQALLESVLQVQPTNSLAKENLSVLRKNRARRARDEQRLRKENQAAGSFKSNDIDVQVQAPMQFIQTFL